MRSLFGLRFALAAAGARACASTSGTSTPQEPTIAPKRVSKRKLQVQLDTEALLKSIPSDPKVHAELSTAELERKVDEWSKMSPAELDELYKKYSAMEEQESKVLQDDSVMQMDVSLKTRASSAIRVFWKDVAIRECGTHSGWFNVLVDGRNVKAFESKLPLIVPTESYALACAREWAEQEGHVNKLLMPLTDIASGSMTVAPNAISPRVDYLMGFYQNDNCYFRAPGIEAEQDALVAPVVEWFGRVFDVEVPRIVGIGHPSISPHDVSRVRDQILAMNLNQYQIVSVCVIAQFTASIMLALALVHGAVDVPTALRINRAEEGHNVDAHGEVKGYHDIREADVTVKIAAAKHAWDLTSDISAAKCAEVIVGGAGDIADAIIE